MANFRALEIEEVFIRDNRIVPKNAPKNPEAKVGGKSRFSHMAFKVLAQILDEKEEKHGEHQKSHKEKPAEGNKDNAEDTTKSKIGSGSPLKRFSSRTSLTGSTRSLAKEYRPQRRTTFMSLVRLATLKKKMARNKRKTSPKPEEEEFPEEIPSVPRFSALLSTEGQYAMMKGYEDALLHAMKTTEVDATMSLNRVRSPAQEAYIIKPSNITGSNNALPTLSQSRNSLMASQTSLSSVSLNSSFARSSSRSARSTSNQRWTSQNHLRDIAGQDHTVVRVIPERSIRLSTSFQGAMKLLDHVKTKRHKQDTQGGGDKPSFNVIKKYNTWSKTWAKEFMIAMPNASCE